MKSCNTSKSWRFIGGAIEPPAPPRGVKHSFSNDWDKCVKKKNSSVYWSFGCYAADERGSLGGS